MVREGLSVLMSVYNNDVAEYLEEALESLQNQTIKADETIIIFDGIVSQDLYDIVEKYTNTLNITTIQNQKNEGLASSLNKGLKLVNFDLIARMDADDIAVKDRFEKQLSFFRNEKDNVDVLGGNIQEFSGNLDNLGSIRKVPLQSFEILKFSKFRSPLNHPTVMIKTEVLRSVGGYPTEFNKLEDYALWVYLLNRKFNVKNISDILVFMRISDDMYERRGGLNQVKGFFKLRIKMYKIGHTNIVETLVGMLINIPTSMISGNLRKHVYRFLRK